MEKLTDKKKINATIFLFTVTYTVSYMTRINLGAMITEIVARTDMTKPMLSAAVTGSAVFYGFGQLLSGYIGDRVSPKRLVFLGLLVTAVMNLLIPLCGNHIQMAAVWCVNGLSQAFMWPPLVKLMVGLFSQSDYQRSSTTVNWGCSFGSIAIYLLSPLMINLGSWKLLFFVTAACGFIMALCWNRFCIEPVFEKTEKTCRTVPGDRKDARLFTPLLIAIMAAIVLHGALRDGVATWMPSFVSETFRLSSQVSILSGVCLPVFAIISLRLALALYQRMPGKPLHCAALVFSLGAVAALILALVSGTSPVGAIACMAVLTGSMHGVNLMLICMVPPFFQRHGNISTVSGILNSCTHIGSAISTYGIALLSESAGWQATAFMWFLIAALGAAVCGVCSRIWK